MSRSQNMKIIHKKLDKFSLNKYLEEYGFDFFHKLRRYQTCTADIEENGLAKIKYFKITGINKENELSLENGDIKIKLNWFECWDFVL